VCGARPRSIGRIRDHRRAVQDQANYATPARPWSRRKRATDRVSRAGSWILRFTLTCECGLFAGMIRRMIGGRPEEHSDGLADRMEGAAVGAAAGRGLFLRSRARAVFGGWAVLDRPPRCFFYRHTS